MFFKKNRQGSKVLNARDNIFDNRGFQPRSGFLLFFSIFLMMVGIIVLFLDGMAFFSPVSPTDSGNQIAWPILLLGMAINFFCVPMLYWSSFHKFKKEDDFWETESFWILALFFFGSFFQYVSGLPYSMVFLPASLVLVFIVHIWTMALSKEVMVADELFQNKSGYFMNLTYLTAYYLILSVVIFTFDLFEKFKYWMN